MLAVEFDGPFGIGGLLGDMVYADKNPAVKVVWQSRQCTAKDLGAAFLLGEVVEFIEAKNEQEFESLLSKYKKGASTQGLIDMKSGLKLHSVKISS